MIRVSILVKMPQGHAINIVTKPSWTVRQLQEAVASHLEVEVDSFSLLLGHSVLRDMDKKLHEYKDIKILPGLNYVASVPSQLATIEIKGPENTCFTIKFNIHASVRQLQLAVAKRANVDAASISLVLNDAVDITVSNLEKTLFQHKINNNTDIFMIRYDITPRPNTSIMNQPGSDCNEFKACEERPNPLETENNLQQIGPVLTPASFFHQVVADPSVKSNIVEKEIRNSLC